jgi:hypothetical protein
VVSAERRKEFLVYFSQIDRVVNTGNASRVRLLFEIGFACRLVRRQTHTRQKRVHSVEICPDCMGKLDVGQPLAHAAYFGFLIESERAVLGWCGFFALCHARFLEDAEVFNRMLIIVAAWYIEEFNPLKGVLSTAKI